MRCYDNRFEIEHPKASEPFFGQDARYEGNRPAYRDNADGKVSRREFDGPADAFDHLDANKDGYLNDAESPARRDMGPPPGPGGPSQDRTRTSSARPRR